MQRFGFYVVIMVENIKVLIFKSIWKGMTSFIKLLVPIHPSKIESLNRKNRHLLEVVRASLIAAKTPISYWGEAITSAVYLINWVPSSSINFQTPLQALTNAVVAPTVPNLPPRVFGCVTFVHLHKHQRTKLTSHALQCVFVGYALHKKGYRCYHPPTRQMYITMDVVFHEDSMYFSSESELQEECYKEIQTFDYDYHISKEDESGQSELVNQEVVIPNSVQEALVDPRWKARLCGFENEHGAACEERHRLSGVFNLCLLILLPHLSLRSSPILRVLGFYFSCSIVMFSLLRTSELASCKLCCLISEFRALDDAGKRGSIEQHENVHELLKAIDEQFITSDKVLASTLIMKLTSLKLIGIKRVREHIMEMRDIVAQLKKLEVEMSESFLMHFILNTLSPQYGPFKISYNTHKDKWFINELMTMCVQEEIRLMMDQEKKGHVKKKYLKFQKWLEKKGYAKPKEVRE
ncbi:Retrovirus-related Pol polyprotein from transposon TNT 1-94 [Vitis vinifera]|uniref:Retrovirus-related Pol polyprotein from transposon TNT 1-94 n=1 Tax=Vitis vinifera TaxID=29760 RepID=A0A438IST1_VITVI|nr:Retrovirus-related Pol polyprotein from transposon TNT 1-94 [Vitis vinifera]